MKELSFIIRPDRLEKVKNILIDKFTCGGMTVSSVMGCGNQKGFSDEYVGVRSNVNLLPKIKIDVIVRDEDMEKIIADICEEIPIGHSGDGKIIVKDVLDVVRMRTKEHGEAAI